MSSKTIIYSILLFTFCFSCVHAARVRRVPQSKKNSRGLLVDGNDEDDDVEKKEKSKIGKGELLLPEWYNRFEIPNQKDHFGRNPSPLLISVHIRVREISDLNENDEQITVTMDVRLWWNDEHIEKANNEDFKPEEGFNIQLDDPGVGSQIKKLDPSFLKKIWKPDLFMESLISSACPEFIAKPVRLIYEPSGKIVLQSRITVTLGCNMDFSYYPADTQECAFVIRSYSFEAHEIELEWGYPKPSLYAFDRNNTNFEVMVTEPLLEQLVEESLDISAAPITFSFGFGDTKSEPVEIKNDKNETYYMLTFNIKARRKMSYHMVQTYLPSLFFIAITWLCFFIPPHMIECRIGVTMTTLLTLTAMFSSVRESSPTVSYVKAIDLWMIACVFFVFGVLLEFALLVWFGLTKECDNDNRNEIKTGEEFEMLDKLNNSESMTKVLRKKPEGISAKKIERLVVPIYFLLFLMFNLFYWPWLLVSSEFYDWKVDTTYNVPDEA